MSGQQTHKGCGGRMHHYVNLCFPPQNKVSCDRCKKTWTEPLFRDPVAEFDPEEHGYILQREATP